MAQRAQRFGWRREDEPGGLAPRATETPTTAPSDANPLDELQARRAEIARMEELALRETESIALRQADSTGASRRWRTASAT